MKRSWLRPATFFLWNKNLTYVELAATIRKFFECKTILSGDGRTKGMAEQPSIIRGKAQVCLRECNRMTLVALVGW